MCDVVQSYNQSPPSPSITFSVFLFVFISQHPSLFIWHLPPLCLTLSCLRASICLQSFPPSPHTPWLSPSAQISPISLSFPQLLLHLPQFDSNHDWCSYQSRKPRLVRDNWTQRHSFPLATSLFYLSQAPSFNKFVPVNKPSKMTPSP